jgi:hypothetical protein
VRSLNIVSLALQWVAMVVVLLRTLLSLIGITLTTLTPSQAQEEGLSVVVVVQEAGGLTGGLAAAALVVTVLMGELLLLLLLQRVLLRRSLHRRTGKPSQWWCRSRCLSAWKPTTLCRIYKRAAQQLPSRAASLRTCSLSS